MNPKEDKKIILSLSDYEELVELSNKNKVDDLRRELTILDSEYISLRAELDCYKTNNENLKKSLDKIKSHWLYKLYKFFKLNGE